MKAIRTNGYTFTPAQQKVDISAATDVVSLGHILAIINVTRRLVIYATGTPGMGGSISAGVVTLDYDTTAMQSGDALAIIYDTGNVPPAGLALETTLAALLAKTPALVSGRQPVDGSGVTQPVSAAALPLPAGASTAALQTTGNSALASILATLQAQVDLASTVWTDDAGSYYVRRDVINETTGVVTVSWSTMAGGASAGPGAGARPLATADRDVFTTYFDVVTNGTGYSIGDVLGLVTIIDANATTPVVTYLWRNLTTSATIAAPTAAHIQRADENVTAMIANFPATQAISAASLPLPAGAGTAANQASILAALVAATPAGTNLMGKVGIDQTTPGTTNKVSIGTDGTVAVAPSTSGGLSSTVYNTFVTTSGSLLVKATPGQVYAVDVWNTDTAPIWFKLFNKATAPVLGGGDSAIFNALVPAGTSRFMEIPHGLAFSLGIGTGISGGPGLGDNTAVVAGKAGFSLMWK